MISVRSQVSLFLLLAAGLCGCSGGGATVSGKVTVAGKEVTAGAIVFSPLAADGDNFPGKPGQADIRPDGSYSLLLEPGPNGLASQFDVRFTPPPVQANSTAKNVIVPYAGLVPKEVEVQVQSGKNVINIELVSGPQR